MIQAIGHIYTHEGVMGFYRGVIPSVLQILPYMGLMFGSYDSLKRSLLYLKVRE